MTDPTFEQRMHTWLELGPTDLPDDAIGQLRQAIDGVAQDRPPIRVFRRPVSAASLRAAAVVAVAVVALGGALWVRSTRPEVATPPPTSDLLSAFPTASLLLERSGTSAGEEVVAIGGLPAGRAFVIAASCTGGDEMTARVYYPPDIVARPSLTPGAEASPQPRSEFATLAVDCDGTVRHLNVGTMELPAETTSDVELTVAPGASWHLAIGEYQQSGTQPAFPPLAPAAGWHVSQDMPANFVTSDLGISIPTTDRDRLVAILVQCFGDPITLSADGIEDAATLDCRDAATTARFEVPALAQQVEAHVETSGATWVRLGGEVDGQIGSSLPSAPPLPDGLADVQFVDSDGYYVAFGRLGSNRQTVVAMPGVFPGTASGDLVGFAVAADGGQRLDLWSISRATKLATLATGSPNSFGSSWVDDRHAQAFYQVFLPNFTQEWRRVAIDGTDDRLIAATPPDAVVMSGILAVDGETLVVDWCPATGACMRVVHDVASGESRQLEIEGERTCWLVGVVGTTVVAASGPTCQDDDPVRITAQPLEGGPREVLAETGIAETGVAGVVVQAAAGPRFVSVTTTGERTRLAVVDLDGNAAVPPMTIDHPGQYDLSIAPTAGPTGDWIVVGGPIGDTPQKQLAGGAVPRLLNVVTGEVIELPNLPHQR
jgi:hypothetical protein